MSGRILYLPDDLAASMLLAAAHAYPSECCGLLEGQDMEGGWIVAATHETANLADDPSRHFLIDPQEQLKLLRNLRGTATRIIGCFHSHPDGPAEPSQTDRAQAYEAEFLWLIAGGSPEVGFALRAYLSLEAGGFLPIPLREES